jgi:hypothetical protein
MTVDFVRIAVESAARLSETPHGLTAAVAAQTKDTYRSCFTNWDRTATVRRSPSRILGDVAAHELYFPPELAPAFAHPLVAGRGEDVQRRFLVQTLYQYLNFTSELEDLAVIPVAMDLSRNRSGLDLAVNARQDAYKIVTDEAWHAQFSHDLYQQIAEATAEPAPPTRLPLFVERLNAVREHLVAGLPAVGQLLFAIVSETLVSSLLAKLPHDTRLPRAVRDTVADHAVDEGRHHAYFRKVLQYLWATLSHGERRRVGPWVPVVILAFLEPDYRAVADSLASLGLSAEEIEQVIVDVYPRERVLSTAAAAARPTIRYFTELGALHDPATADAFAVLTGR